MKRKWFVTVISVSLLLSAFACGVGGDVADAEPTAMPTEPPPTETSLPTAKPSPVPTETTSPTATLQPQPSREPTQTTQPTPTPTQDGLALQGPAIAYNGITFEFDPSLGDTVYASTPTDYVAGYTRFAFGPAGYCSDVGCVQVFEVQAYEEAFPGIPLPPVGAATILRAQNQTLDFQGGGGTRSIRMYAQDIYWVSNESIVYDFQGFTDDEQYYVLVTFPIDAPILLSSSDPEKNTNAGALPVPVPLPDDPFERQDVIAEYNREAERQLDLLAAEDFVPDLGALDALVVSLRIEIPPP
jgi:hypothetical protein